MIIRGLFSSVVKTILGDELRLLCIVFVLYCLKPLLVRKYRDAAEDHCHVTGKYISWSTMFALKELYFLVDLFRIIKMEIIQKLNRACVISRQVIL